MPSLRTQRGVSPPLIACPAHARHRSIMKAELGTRANNLNGLLNNEKSIKAVLKYIARAKCLAIYPPTPQLPTDGIDIDRPRASLDQDYRIPTPKTKHRVP
ncbi:hypothetical protein BDR05DRAFT_959890 [Suillus weaverae]|nr:hypothetical protein BDR05DRAFT_959890 [Suillus weaverae]